MEKLSRIQYSETVRHLLTALYQRNLDSLAKATIFSTLDLASGYWQVELEESAKEKTAFFAVGGNY